MCMPIAMYQNVCLSTYQICLKLVSFECIIFIVYYERGKELEFEIFSLPLLVGILWNLRKGIFAMVIFSGSYKNSKKRKFLENCTGPNLIYLLSWMHELLV